VTGRSNPASARISVDARAVGAEHRHQFAAVDFDIDVREHFGGAITRVELLRCQHEIALWRPACGARLHFNAPSPR
jgi:hypothetical protein